MKRAFEKIINLREFESNFSTLLNKKDSFYAYFYASYDKNGVSWCSDCTKVKPILEEVSQQSLSSQQNIMLYYFPIEDPQAYKSPDFVYRKNSHIKLERIPTLIYFREGKELSRMVEDQISHKYDLMEFFNLSKDLKSKF